jgi:hypothetical protein
VGSTGKQSRIPVRTGVHEVLTMMLLRTLTRRNRGCVIFVATACTGGPGLIACQLSGPIIFLDDCGVEGLKILIENKRTECISNQKQFEKRTSFHWWDVAIFAFAKRRIISPINGCPEAFVAASTSDDTDRVGAVGQSRVAIFGLAQLK